MFHHFTRNRQPRRITPLALVASVELSLPIPGPRVEVGVVRAIRPRTPFDRDPRPTNPGGMSLAVAA